MAVFVILTKRCRVLLYIILELNLRIPTGFDFLRTILREKTLIRYALNVNYIKIYEIHKVGDVCGYPGVHGSSINVNTHSM